MQQVQDRACVEAIGTEAIGTHTHSHDAIVQPNKAAWMMMMMMMGDVAIRLVASLCLARAQHKIKPLDNENAHQGLTNQTSKSDTC